MADIDAAMRLQITTLMIQCLQRIIFFRDWFKLYLCEVAVLFKMGDPNPFIEKFINLIPSHPHDTTDLVDKPIYLDDLKKPSHIDQYDWFHYKGSLTTEPYTETVSWLVMKDILDASPQEIMKINELEGNNARHIQAMYDREIEE